jgi:extracellular elastinolytic metalloproteinase
MPKDIDQRDYSFIRAFDPVTAEMKSSKKLLGNQTIKINYVNQFIGGAEQIQSLYPSDEAPAGITEAVHVASPQLELSDQAVIALALKHLERTGAALGFRQSEKPEFVPDPLVKRTSGGARIVNFLQHHHGIPVFQMERSVEIDKTGAVRSVDGMSTSLPLDLEIMPRVSLENAVLAAADYIALPTGKVDHFTQEPIPDTVIDLGDYEPKVLARIPFTSQPSVLDKGPFGDVIPAHLVFFYQGPETRLAWHMIISTKGIRDQYIVIVEADSKTRDPKHPSVLYGKSTLSYMALATGEVWKHNPDVNKTRKPVNFPRPVEEYPVNPPPVLPQGFPFHWVKDGLDVTQGNNTIAVFGAEGLPCRGVQGIDDIIVFDPDEEKGNEQKVLNAFYFCNFRTLTLPESAKAAIRSRS